MATQQTALTTYNNPASTLENERRVIALNSHEMLSLTAADDMETDRGGYKFINDIDIPNKPDAALSMGVQTDADVQMNIEVPEQRTSWFQRFLAETEVDMNADGGLVVGEYGNLDKQGDEAMAKLLRVIDARIHSNWAGVAEAAGGTGGEAAGYVTYAGNGMNTVADNDGFYGVGTPVITNNLAGGYDVTAEITKVIDDVSTSRGIPKFSTFAEAADRITAKLDNVTGIMLYAFVDSALLTKMQGLSSGGVYDQNRYTDAISRDSSGRTQSIEAAVLEITTAASRTLRLIPYTNHLTPVKAISGTPVTGSTTRAQKIAAIRAKTATYYAKVPFVIASNQLMVIYKQGKRPNVKMLGDKRVTDNLVARATATLRAPHEDTVMAIVGANQG